jgi:hypothetical protein
MIGKMLMKDFANQFVIVLSKSCDRYTPCEEDWKQKHLAKCRQP